MTFHLSSSIEQVPVVCYPLAEILYSLLYVYAGLPAQVLTGLADVGDVDTLITKPLIPPGDRNRTPHQQFQH